MDCWLNKLLVIHRLKALSKSMKSKRWELKPVSNSNWSLKKSKKRKLMKTSMKMEFKSRPKAARCQMRISINRSQGRAQKMLAVVLGSMLSSYRIPCQEVQCLLHQMFHLPCSLMIALIHQQACWKTSKPTKRPVTLGCRSSTQWGLQLNLK